MPIFSFAADQSIGEVRGVDTSQVYVRVLSSDRLLHARVGRLVTIQGQDANEWLVGIINRVWRDPIEITEDTEDKAPTEQNAVQVTLVGTYRAKHGDEEDYFTRAVLSLPDINRPVFPVEEKALESFMNIIGGAGKEPDRPLEIGTYTLDRKAKAFLNGDKLFQRHAALLGSTGSGKSWAVASLLEQIHKLDWPDVIVFDLHGEYVNLPYARKLRIAGPNDLEGKAEGVLFLPYWLLSYEEMQAVFIDYSEQNAPNQSMAVFEGVAAGKKAFLEREGRKEILDSFTVDSPVPFSLGDLVAYLEQRNAEMTETGEVYKTGTDAGKPKMKQGPLHDKLTRLLIRLRSKISDKRYGFLFTPPSELNNYGSLNSIALALMGHGGVPGYLYPGIKIIDFSEVPSDILPVVVSMVARLVFQIQFWSEPGKDNEGRHPILLVCDEAHLYMPGATDRANALERRSVDNFERIAKEGRKYGVGMLVVSQRPSDVSQTVLSQCNNIIALRLSNERDKSVVKNLLPDSLSGLLDVLPGLEVGEAVVVGDATLLPTRIVLNKPEHKPVSSTVDFWQRWKGLKGQECSLEQAVENYRRQTRRSSPNLTVFRG